MCVVDHKGAEFPGNNKQTYKHIHSLTYWLISFIHQYRSGLRKLLSVQVDAHYDEQKELIQQQLVTEQQMISDVNRVYSVSPTTRPCTHYTP